MSNFFVLSVLIILISGIITSFLITDSFAQESTLEIISELNASFELPEKVVYYYGFYDSKENSEEQFFDTIIQVQTEGCQLYNIQTHYFDCDNIKFQNKNKIESNIDFYYIESTQKIQYISKVGKESIETTTWIILADLQDSYVIFFPEDWGFDGKIIYTGTEGYLSEVKNVENHGDKIIVESFKKIFEDKRFFKKTIPVNIFILGHELSSSELLKLKTALPSSISPVLIWTEQEIGIEYQYDYNFESYNEEISENLKELIYSESEKSDLVNRVLSEVSLENSWVNEFHPEWIIEKNNWPDDPILEVEHEYRIVDVQPVEEFLFTNLIKDRHENEVNLIFLDYDLEELNFLRNYKVSSIDQSTDKKFEAIGMMGYGGENNLYFIDLHSIPWKQTRYNQDTNELETFWSEDFKTLHDCPDCFEQIISNYTNEFLNSLVNPYVLYDPGVYSKINIELLLYQRSGVNSITSQTLPKLINEGIIKNELSELYPYADWDISTTLADRNSKVLDKWFIDELERPNLLRDYEGEILEGAESYQIISSETFRPIMKWWADEVNSQGNFVETMKTIPILLVVYDGNPVYIYDRGFLAAGIAYEDNENPNESCCIFAVKNADDFWNNSIGVTDLILHEMGHVMGLNHPFSSFDKENPEGNENNFFNFYSSPMTYATPGYPTACAGYFNNIWTNQEVKSKYGHGFEIQLVNVNLLEDECGITDTKFTDFEKDRIFDLMVAMQLQKANNNIQLYKANTEEIDQVKLLQIESLITSIYQEFLKKNPNKNSVLMEAVEAKKKSEMLVSNSQGILELAPEGSIILYEYADYEQQLVVYLNKDIIEKDSPVTINIKGNFFEKIPYVNLFGNTVTLFSESDKKEYSYSMSISESGSYEFTKIIDYSFPDGNYLLTINDDDLQFSLNKGINFKLYKENYENKIHIPEWVRNNAKWWAQGTIEDNDFVNGLQFLIKERVIIIPKSSSESSAKTNEIPDWVKNNAKWWSEELISDSDFVKGVQHLVNQGIIKVS